MNQVRSALFDVWPIANQLCEAARHHPAKVTCPPQSIPPIIAPPAHSCALEGIHCRSVAR